MELKHGLNNPHNRHNRHNNDFGTIVDGYELIDLTQNAYITQAGAPAECYYQALGESRSRTDVDGEPVRYMVKWEIANPDTEDESEACDWDAFEIEQV